jgi:hypothetical protein
MVIRLAAVARRDLKTLVSVGTMEDAPHAASALAGSFDADSAATTERVERVSRRGRSSGSNCDRDTNRRTSASLLCSRAVLIDCRASARTGRADRRCRRRAGGCPLPRRDGPGRCEDPPERCRRSFQARSTNRAAPTTARRLMSARDNRLDGLSTPVEARPVAVTSVNRNRPPSSRRKKIEGEARGLEYSVFLSPLRA